MLYGDLGRFPIDLIIKKRIIGVWYNIILSTNKLSSMLYQYVFRDYVLFDIHYDWLLCVKTILDQCGLSSIWNNQHFQGSKELLLNKISESLEDQFKQD